MTKREAKKRAFRYTARLIRNALETGWEDMLPPEENAEDDERCHTALCDVMDEMRRRGKK